MRLNSQNANNGLYNHKNPQLTAGGFVEVRAFSKINLFLNITGKRDDGYHNIESVMQSLEFCDNIFITKGNLHNGTVKLTTSHPRLTTGAQNLVVKAAKLLMREYGIMDAINIKLDKRIPIGAGLGGGSSNCAATLHGINKLFNLGIPLSRLIELGTSLGADVPFCLVSGTAIAQGIGEVLTSLPSPPNCTVLLAFPHIHISTTRIFNKLHYDMFNQGLSLNNFLAVYKTQSTSQIASNFANTFTAITAGMYPQITSLISGMRNNGALGASMTGTGSTVFGYFNNEHNAIVARNILQQLHPSTSFFITRPVREERTD